MQKVEGRLFYFKCPKCGQNNTMRVTNFTKFETECKFCHEKQERDIDDIYVRTHLIADAVNPNRYVGDIERTYKDEFPMLLLPIPMRLHINIARKHNCELRYVKIDKICSVYAVRKYDICIKLSVVTKDEDFHLLEEELKKKLSNTSVLKASTTVESDDSREEYFVQYENGISSATNKPFVELQYYILDEKNKFLMSIVGDMRVWDEMKYIIHDFELGEQLVDRMDTIF